MLDPLIHLNSCAFGNGYDYLLPVRPSATPGPPEGPFRLAPHVHRVDFDNFTFEIEYVLSGATNVRFTGFYVNDEGVLIRFAKDCAFFGDERLLDNLI